MLRRPDERREAEGTAEEGGAAAVAREEEEEEEEGWGGDGWTEAAGFASVPAPDGPRRVSG